MALLAYCVNEAKLTVTVPPIGVGGEAITTIVDGGLRCFVSMFTAAPSGTKSMQESVLSFHGVLQHIFSQSAIIPFRYPTTVEDEAALVAFLNEHASDYEESLIRLRDKVQMEIRASWKAESRPTLPAGQAQSGAEYLRAKQAQHSKFAALSAGLRTQAQCWIADWQERPSADGLRMFALVRRSEVAEFKRALDVPVNPDFLVRVSGPWPATEFLKRSDAGF